jgi:hypothetical protein
MNVNPKNIYVFYTWTFSNHFSMQKSSKDETFEQLHSKHYKFKTLDLNMDYRTICKPGGLHLQNSIFLWMGPVS